MFGNSPEISWIENQKKPSRGVLNIGKFPENYRHLMWGNNNYSLEHSGYTACFFSFIYLFVFYL